ncbi:LURP-one-related/scramblase family protein [Marinilactibacillus sp. Marseille-P9653]|uniref:LURP-one-related/scramblase family protein n=1 Tax=Marinilactibacillus sp. Marseille-P9653 TaxID=2866583 RepID=UPI001CE46806|nr:LURP-one-related family protein [Marinilactibacillus sp. Marseille-P9653]
MKYFIKQKVFSFNNQFSVKDESGQALYQVEGKMLSLGNKLRIYNMYQEEVLYIEQKLLTFLPEYDLYKNGEKVATVKKEFRFFKNDYSILGPDWNVEGSIMAHDYVIEQRGNVIADINKEWLSWGDTYAIDIRDESQAELLLGVVIVIDCVFSAQRNNGAS